MKKVLFALCVIGLMAGLCGCEKRGGDNNPDTPESQTPITYSHSTFINGQLCYLPNPFSPEVDTILCIRNAYLFFNVNNKEYCSYVRDLLSTFGGDLSECRFHSYDLEHQWEFVPLKEQYFYPVRNGHFISLVDQDKGILSDSIYLSAESVNQRGTPVMVTVYTSEREGELSEDALQLYMNDNAMFQGNDFMSPKFISDTIIPSGERIVCFDGQYGPFIYL